MTAFFDDRVLPFLIPVLIPLLVLTRKPVPDPFLTADVQRCCRHCPNTGNNDSRHAKGPE